MWPNVTKDTSLPTIFFCQGIVWPRLFMDSHFCSLFFKSESLHFILHSCALPFLTQKLTWCLVLHELRRNPRHICLWASGGDKTDGQNHCQWFPFVLWMTICLPSQVPFPLQWPCPFFWLPLCLTSSIPFSDFPLTVFETLPWLMPSHSKNSA